MTARYVRPDASHSVTRDGLTYETAWGGFGEIVWAQLAAGFSLYVCGSHVSATSRNTGSHGGNAGARVIVRGDHPGDPGKITFTGLGFGVQHSHTELYSLELVSGTSFAVQLNAAALTNVKVHRCKLVCGPGSTSSIFSIREVDGMHFSDIAIEDNHSTGNASAGSAIRWWVSAANANSTVTRLSIRRNLFKDMFTSRAVIRLYYDAGVNAGTKLRDIVIDGNAFENVTGICCEVGGNGTATVDRDLGIKVRWNFVRKQRQVSTLGGFLAVYQFGLSPTSGFGHNVIAYNKAFDIEGAAGFADLFYGTYIVEHNYVEGSYATQYDGNGVLFDLGTHDSIARWNTFKDLRAAGAIYGSGMGIYVISATNCVAYGNLIDGCRIGLGFFCPTGSTQSAKVYNNTFLNCSVAGVYHGQQNTSKLDTHCQNNIFTASEASAKGVNNTGAQWTGTESHNVFFGFGANTGHVNSVHSLTSDPKLDHEGWPKADSPVLDNGVVNSFIKKPRVLNGARFGGRGALGPSVMKEL